MRVEFWYVSPIKRWRWALTSDTDTSIMVSGDSIHIKDAMKDVANTVELLQKKHY
jgi:hypothetical protein